MDYVFELAMKVRDYEVDAQGVVNNANYQHYLEHARHEFIESLGTTFSELTEQAILPFVTRIELDFKRSLRGSDHFIVKLNVDKRGVRLLFYEDIYLKDSGELVLKSVVCTVCTQNGKVLRNGFFDDLLSPYFLSREV